MLHLIPTITNDKRVPAKLGKRVDVKKDSSLLVNRVSCRQLMEKVWNLYKIIIKHDDILLAYDKLFSDVPEWCHAVDYFSARRNHPGNKHRRIIMLFTHDQALDLESYFGLTKLRRKRKKQASKKTEGLGSDDHKIY